MTATDRFELKNITGELSDARFCRNDIAYDRSNLSWTLTCWGPRRRHGELRTECWQKLRITVSNVVAYEPSFSETVDYYEISSMLLSEDSAQLRIACQYGADFRLFIEKLKVELIEVGQPEGSPLRPATGQES
jgi:hypothetical protein